MKVTIDIELKEVSVLGDLNLYELYNLINAIDQDGIKEWVIKHNVSVIATDVIIPTSLPDKWPWSATKDLHINDFPEFNSNDWVYNTEPAYCEPSEYITTSGITPSIDDVIESNNMRIRNEIDKTAELGND